MGYQVREPVDARGVSPWRRWVDSLDVRARARVRLRIWRVHHGNLGDHRSVGKGVWEPRLRFGSGYRVYFGLTEGGRVVLLLTGGDKNSQRRDIQRAHKLWQGYGGKTDGRQKSRLE